MSIDWQKVKEKPDKPHKVLGQTLLDQRGKINDLENNLQKTTQALNKNMTELAGANSQIESLQNNISELNKSISSKGGEITSLTQSEQKSHTERDSLQAQVATLTSTKKSLEQAKSALEGEKSTLESKVAEMESKLNDTISQKNQELSTLKATLEQNENEIGELNLKLGQGEARMSELSSSIENKGNELQGTISGKDSLINELNAKIQELTREAGDTSDNFNKMQELSIKVEELEKSLALKEEQIEEYESKMSDFTEPVSEMPKYSMDTRIICPMCNGTDISDFEDKTKVLSYVGHVPLYSKGKHCRKCGYEWK